MSTEERVKKLLGCSSIHERVAGNSILNPYLDDLVENRGVYGIDPVGAYITLKTIDDVSNRGPIKERLGDTKATYIKVSNLGGPWGVYSSVIALFGDNMWYTQDRSGAEHLRIYKEGAFPCCKTI